MTVLNYKEQSNLMIYYQKCHSPSHALLRNHRILIIARKRLQYLRSLQMPIGSTFLPNIRRPQVSAGRSLKERISRNQSLRVVTEGTESRVIRESKVFQSLLAVVRPLSGIEVGEVSKYCVHVVSHKVDVIQARRHGRDISHVRVDLFQPGHVDVKVVC